MLLNYLSRPDPFTKALPFVHDIQSAITLLVSLHFPTVSSFKALQRPLESQHSLLDVYWLALPESLCHYHIPILCCPLSYSQDARGYTNAYKKTPSDNHSLAW